MELIEAVFIPLFALWRRETISPRVILWAGVVNKQAASGSNYCCMKLSVLEGNKISHGLIISHDTDEQDFTPNYQEDKVAWIQLNWTFSTILNSVHFHGGI